MSAVVWLSVGALGAVGAMARFVLDSAISERAGRRFPLGTLTINVSGSLLLGLLAGLSARGDTLLLAGTATLGSYTTFSTWVFEMHRSAEDADGHLAALNLALSLAAGLGAAALGRAIGAAL